MGNWTLEYTAANQDGTTETVYKYFNRKPGKTKLADIMSRDGRKIVRWPIVYRSK